MSQKHQYREAANLLEATSQLSSHFDAYHKVPKIAEIQARIDDIENTLRGQVFEDFRT